MLLKLGLDELGGAYNGDCQSGLRCLKEEALVECD